MTDQKQFWKQNSENLVTNAHIQCIMSLPIITQNNAIKIYDS